MNACRGAFVYPKTSFALGRYRKISFARTGNTWIVVFGGGRGLRCAVLWGKEGGLDYPVSVSVEFAFCPFSFPFSPLL